MLEIKVRNLTEYVAAVCRLHVELSQGMDEELWFRGSHDHTFPLLPGVYRDEFLKCDEQTLFLAFKSAAAGFVVHQGSDDWAWYILMQHHSLPTRLLDWSESALVALYFALYRKDGHPRPATELVHPCVWFLSPGDLNQQLHELSKPALFTVGGELLKYWLPGRCERDAAAGFQPGASDHPSINEFPLAIFPPKANARILSQRGTFTVHGSSPKPLEAMLSNSTSQDSARLGRVLLSEHNPTEFQKDLTRLGVVHSMIFPELDSIANDVLRLHRGN
jgi:hypothetical protein